MSSNVRFRSLTILFVLLSALLAACSPSSPATTAPTAAPGGTAATAAPAAGSEATPAAGDTTAAPEAPTAAAAPATPTLAPTVVSSGEGCAPGAPKVTWYVGLGAGTDADVIPKETAWVEKFNKSQTDACLILQIVHNPESYDTLKAQIAAGTTPDIVGPTGRTGRASFQGAWQDITPLAEQAKFDLSQYDPALLDFVKDGGVQVGLPFALYPGVIYYNKALFDEARLPYPPHKVGEKYQGKEWNLETMTELAKQLTVDKNGNTPNDPSFDPNAITQFGLWQGFSDARRMTAWFGGEAPYDAKDPTTAKIPESWRTQWKWYYDGIWKSRFMPNNDYANSERFNKGNAFGSGNVAMTWSFTWYTCCFDMQKINWDVAVVPSVNGKLVAGMDGDTFAIMKQSKNQDAAFKVLVRMVNDPELAEIYGGLPGKSADRAAFFKSLDAKTAPNKIDWSVVEEMTKYPDLPGHEAWMPNLIKSNDLFAKFKTLMDQTPDLEIDKEIDTLEQQLDTLFKEPGAAQ